MLDVIEDVQIFMYGIMKILAKPRGSSKFLGLLHDDILHIFIFGEISFIKMTLHPRNKNDFTSFQFA